MATNGRDVALDTVKSDIVALQRELNTMRQRSIAVVEQRIGAQPIQSVLVAFAAGILCSKLLLRRFH